MIKRLPFFVIVILSFTAIHAWAQQPRPRIAVLEFKPEGVSDPEAAAVSDRLRSGFVNLGVFTILDRDEIETVLAEQAFQQEGLTEPEQAVTVGRLLNVEYIVTGRVRALKGAYHVNTRMIHVQTAEIVRSEDIIYRGDMIGLLSENMDSVAAKLSQVRPKGEGPSVQIASRPVKKQNWTLWSGGAVLIAGILLQLDAQSAYDDSVAQANQAEAASDPDMYTDAVAKKEDAETQQAVAFVVGGVGAALILYYLLSSDSDESFSYQGQLPSRPPPFMIYRQSGGVSVRFTTNW